MTEFNISGGVHCADFVGGDKTITYGFSAEDVERLIEKVMGILQAGGVFLPAPDNPDVLQAEHDGQKLTFRPGAAAQLANQNQIRAYCRWLSEVTGRSYRLPSEAEWEAAARGDRSGVYPWGNDWDPTKANNIEGRVMKPSPVGAYAAAGAVGPFGAEDQAGNVWDWTNSLYLPYPYNAEKSEVEDDPGERVVRGGSWDNSPWDVRCAYRFRLMPGLFSDGIGFRLFSPWL